MNRYYWFAILLGIIASVSIAAIWIIDVDNTELQKRIEFTLIIGVGAVSTILTIILYFLGKTRQKGEEPIIKPYEDVIQDSELLSRSESISQYLSHLEALLDEFGAKRTRFVELSTEIEIESIKDEIKLLQNFEWSERNWIGDDFTTTRKPINFLHAHESFQRYVLLGDPGAGKTTCLQYLVHELISSYKSGTSELLPLFVPFSDWCDRRMSALDFLRTSFAKLAGSGNYLVKEFDNLLAQGKLLVILDGLNEMPDRYYHQETEEESKVRGHINILIELSSGGVFRSKQDSRERSLRELAVSRAIRTHFIVSCRTHEFFGSPDWQELHVLSMDTHQIRQFLQNYMGIEKANELEKMLEENATLNTLAQNPFFLQSMISAFSPELKLVQNKGQFLEYLTRKLLEREKNRGVIFETRNVIKTASQLAFRTLKKNLIGSQVELSTLGRKYHPAINVLLGTGLIVTRGEGQVSFYHQLIQEFFAAIALRDKHVKGSMKNLLCHKKWSEVIILWHDIGSGGALFSKLLKGLKQRYGLRIRPWLGDWLFIIFFAFLFTNLLIDLILKGSYILPILIRYPVEFLILAIVFPLVIRTVGSYITYNRQAIANSAYVLGHIGNPIAIDHLIGAFTRVRGGQHQTEVARSLALFKNNAVPNLIHGLSSKNVRIKSGCIESLGLIGAVQAVDPLLVILDDDDRKCFLTTVTALSRIEDPRTGPAIAKTIYRSPEGCLPTMTHAGVAVKFQNFRKFDPELFNVLEQGVGLNQSPFCRNIGLLAIGNYGYAEGLSILEQIAMDIEEPKNLRDSAITSISRLYTADAVPVLINIYEKNPIFLESVSNSISNVRYCDSTDHLISLLNHSEWRIRLSAVVALGVIASPDSLPILTKKCSDESKEVRSALAKAFGSIGSEEAIILLNTLCNDPEHIVRVSALETLDFFFPSSAKEIFITLAKDGSYPDREKAIEYLGFYRFSDVRTALLELCADTNDDVKVQAIESLQRLDQSLAQELRHVHILKRRGLKRKFITYLRRKFQIDEYLMLVREAEYRKGVSQKPPTAIVFDRILEDSELKRKFRPWLITFLILLIFSCLLLPGIALAAGTRLIIFVSAILWNIKWISLSFVILAIITYLPGIRKGKQIKYLGYLYTTVRFIGVVIAIVLVSATILNRWWLLIGFLVIGIIALVVFRKSLGKFFTEIYLKRFEQIIPANPIEDAELLLPEKK